MSADGTTPKRPEGEEDKPDETTRPPLPPGTKPADLLSVLPQRGIDALVKNGLKPALSRLAGQDVEQLCTEIHKASTSFATERQRHPGEGKALAEALVRFCTPYETYARDRGSNQLPTGCTIRDVHDLVKVLPALRTKDEIERATQRLDAMQRRDKGYYHIAIVGGAAAAVVFSGITASLVFKGALIWEVIGVGAAATTPVGAITGIALIEHESRKQELIEAARVRVKDHGVQIEIADGFIGLLDRLKDKHGMALDPGPREYDFLLNYFLSRQGDSGETNRGFLSD